MKKLLLFILPALIVFACGKDDASPDGCGLELTLTKSVSSWTGDQLTGSDLSFQESIVLSTDKTYVKKRTLNGVVTREEGTYEYVTLYDKQYVKLIYGNPESNVRASCTVDGELIEVISNTEFQNTSWAACDGPMLIYEAKPVVCNAND